MNLILSIILPVTVLSVTLFFEKKPFFCRILSFSAAVISSVLACSAAFTRPHIIFPWLGGVLDFSMRVDTLSAGMLVLVSMLSLSAFLYAFIARMPVGIFRVLLLMQTASAGAVSADSLAALSAFAGLLPLCMYRAPFLSENRIGNLQSTGRPADRKDLSHNPAVIIEGRREKSLIYGAVLLVSLIAGISVMCYISGTMNLVEISMAKLTLDYAWAVSAFVLITVPILSITGVFPFSFRISGNLARPLWFRAYATALFLTLGISMLLRFFGFAFRPGETAYTVIFWLGAITGLSAAVSAFTENSLRRLTAFIIQAQTGIMLCGLSVDTSFSGGLIHIFMLIPAGFALTLLAGFVENQTGTDDLYEISRTDSFRHRMPVTTTLFLLYSLSFAALPPFGDSFRHILAGTLPGHPFFFITVCLIQIITIAALLKTNCSFFEGNGALSDGDASVNTGENTSQGRVLRDPSPWNLVIAGIPFLVLLSAGFGACMPEQLFVLPVMEAMDIKNTAPAYSAALLYMIQLIVFLLGCLVYQAGNALTGKGPARCSDFIADTAFVCTLRKIMQKNIFEPFFDFLTSVITDTSVPATGAAGSRINNVAGRLVWDIPSAALKKIAAMTSTAAEASLNFSMAAALFFATAMIIAAATGGFN